MLVRKKRLPFYAGLTTVVVVIVIVLSAFFLWIIHRESKVAAINLADQLFTAINARNLQHYEDALQAAAILTSTAAKMPAMKVLPIHEGLSYPGMPVMLQALSFYNFLFSIYCGYEDGSFIQIIAVRNDEKLCNLYAAPPKTYYVLRTIAQGTFGARPMQQHWQFLDKDCEILGRAEDLDSGYDPRKRPWYTRARIEPGAFFTQPYVFSSSGLPGITCARKLAGGIGVLGCDITLGEFTNALKKQQVSENSVMFVFEHDGHIILNPGENPVKQGANNKLTFLKGDASSDPRIQAVVANYRWDPDIRSNHAREISIKSVPYLVRFTPVEIASGIDQIIAVAAPVSDFTGHITAMEHDILVFSGIMLMIIIPLAFLMSRGISSSLMRLESEAKKIKRSDFSDSEPFDSGVKELHSLISAFFLMKTRIKRLLKQQRNLFDNFTKLIAAAIDAKSPYTGGHCARVPVIAQMLADAACECENGPFADFIIKSEDQRWEFEVAAWLHDCGKVTTPEHVVDKATKLEIIYNRIHEVRMRFEVLLRDAQIEYYQGVLEGKVARELLQAELEKRQQQIVDDFSFVAECNVGGEFMADEKIERLHHIAGQTWTRYLDDQIGISRDEADRKPSPKPSLPAEEPLLADKPEHLIKRPDIYSFEDNDHGFDMPVPKYLFNQGELHNLSIRRGTLSEEDRFKINEHIVQTIKMLDKLDFPDYLANVPEFAGAHHETMNGTGYPCRRKKEEMSIPARIMAIADIFEALTAADRPYKAPKTLSEAVKIMSFMRNDQHIDPDLFDLFLTRRVYRKYAEKHLKPEQLDEVDISRYLSKSMSS